MNIALNIFDKFLGAITNNKKVVVKEQKSEISHSFKVGDIFVESWGYEQTNVDAYQVVKVNKASVVLREIAIETVKSTGWASDEVRPVKDSFVDEITYTKRVSNNGYLKGIKHGTLFLHSAGRAYHRSWYA